MNRLIEVIKGGATTQEYTYDARGNRENQTGVTAETNGNETLSYNLWNQLVSVADSTGTTSFEYGPTGLRVKKGSKNYIYDVSGNLKAEADASNNITATYIWGGNRLLIKKLADGTQYYYLYNGHGDVVQITDSAGNIVNSYEYDEWGNITSQTETIENEFKYAGQIYDSETGLYYLRARYYDPTTGRFISKDSNEGNIVNPLSLNLYTYCENNPNKYIDYNGQNPVVIYMYIMAVACSPDTQMDAQLVALDFSQGNYFALAFDSAGALIPGATGLGKAADTVASKALKFFGRNTAEIQGIRETFGDGKVVMPYKYLKQIVKGTGLETHHLIEKRFANTLGLKADDIMSIAIDKDTHNQITQLMREKIGYKYDLGKDYTTWTAKPQNIWNATRDVYKEFGLTEYLDPLKQQLIDAGYKLNWGTW